MTGFPKDKNPMIYENKQIYHFRQPVECYNIRKKEDSYIGMYKLDLPMIVVEKGLDLNGMSGSPVFVYQKSKNYRGFAGIYLQKEHFLKSDIVYNVLSIIVNNNPCKSLNPKLLNLIG